MEQPCRIWGKSTTCSAKKWLYNHTKTELCTWLLDILAETNMHGHVNHTRDSILQIPWVLKWSWHLYWICVPVLLRSPWPWCRCFSPIRKFAIVASTRKQPSLHWHWGQPHEATVVKMAPARPLASRSFCLLAPLCDHRSLSNLQQRSTEAWYTLYQNDRLVPFRVFVQ